MVVSQIGSSTVSDSRGCVVEWSIAHLPYPRKYDEVLAQTKKPAVPAGSTGRSSGHQARLGGLRCAGTRGPSKIIGVPAARRLATAGWKTSRERGSFNLRIPTRTSRGPNGEPAPLLKQGHALFGARSTAQSGARLDAAPRGQFAWNKTFQRWFSQ
ncbi:hypothetical protein MES5069_460080 [Mesorhizobium escarrei]|uniref:Uncharacterized protein n=1 Tax=Mesorhizobium escarrei TaxID=666018 RepID=A0ABM9E893_9HYPH|nr:hypothetical protein MES5069_460080 [Mesorhizobium escarrei]